MSEERKYKRKPVDKQRGRRTTSDGRLLPTAERKFDGGENADEDKLEAAIRKQQRRERHLFPLRINATTVIYVTKDKCNEAYKRDYLTNKYRKL